MCHACRMARITRLPPSEMLGVVDAKKLMEGRPPITFDEATGAPSEMRSLVVNEDPKMVLLPHFLSPAECEHMLQLAEGHWTRSLIGAIYTGEDEAAGPVKDGIQSRAAKTRTSSSAVLRPGQSAIIERIELRLARLAKLPVEQLERLVVVRYQEGEQFSEHHDGKFRPITIFVYLNELEDGGDTFFPHLGFSFIPRTGCAVMWPNAKEDGTEDSRMLHAGRPPKAGIKYGVNCFFNQAPMRITWQPTTGASAEESFKVDIRGLTASQEKTGEGLKSFSLNTEPPIVAVPNFATEEELQKLLDLAGGMEALQAARATITIPGCFEGQSVALKIFSRSETRCLAEMEQRLTDVAKFPNENLGLLKIIECGTTLGLCNRGCGQRAGILCLSEQDEVLFPYLGVRLLLRRGDLIEWPNAWQTERIEAESGTYQRVVEDFRTKRVHLKQESGPTFALDVTFHDTPLEPQAGMK